MEEASGDEGECARAPRACEDGKRWGPLAGMIHSETNEHVNKSSTRALEFLPLYRSVGASPLFFPLLSVISPDRKPSYGASSVITLLPLAPLP